MKIHDCFIFYNELDILELRLNSMYEYVDRFVIVEANKTFTGKEKPLYFQENKKRFSKFAEKIFHVILESVPVTDNPWEIETFQRNAISFGLFNALADDIIIISDVDEIINKDVLVDIKRRKENYFYFRMPISYFKFNYICVQGEINSIWSVAARKCLLDKLTPQGIRNIRCSQNQLPLEFKIYSNAGWHFSFIGNNEFIKNKIQSFSHQEYNKKEILDTIDDYNFDGKDPLGRHEFSWQRVDPKFFPDYLLQCMKKYNDYML